MKQLFVAIIILFNFYQNVYADTVWIDGQSAEGHIIAEEGTKLRQDPVLNFIGDDILAETDASTGRTNVTVDTTITGDSTYLRLDATNDPMTGDLTLNNTATALTLPAFTQGSIAFFGAGGVISEDNTNFFWDDTNDLFLLGGTTAAGADTILGADGSAIFNETGADVDFRIETTQHAHTFFVDSDLGDIGINTSAFGLNLYYMIAQGVQPDGVSTSAGTQGKGVSFTGAQGGNTDIATTGIGGTGGAITYASGAGGSATAAATSCTGGQGGTLAYSGGLGGIAMVGGTGSNTGGTGGKFSMGGGGGGTGFAATTGAVAGGDGGDCQMNAGSGGIGLNTGGGTGTGGDGGDVIIASGIAGLGIPTASGSAGSIKFQTGATLIADFDPNSDFRLLLDNQEIQQGAGQDTAQYYDGTDWNFNAGVVGTGGFQWRTGADTDLVFTFNGTTNTGVMKWMEDEDLFQFTDDMTFDLDIKAANIGADTDNSVVILNASGFFKTDEIDPDVWTPGTLVDGSGTANYVSKWSDSDTLTDSVIYDDGTNVVIGAEVAESKFHVHGGTTTLRGPNNASVLDIIENTSSSVGAHFVSDGVNDIKFRLKRTSDGGTQTELYANGNSYINALSGNVAIGGTTATAFLEVFSDGSNTAGRFRLDESSTSLSTTHNAVLMSNEDTTANNWAKFSFAGAAGTISVASIGAQISDHTNSYADLAFWTRGTGGWTEKVRIEDNGNTGFGDTTPDHAVEILNSTGPQFAISHTDTIDYATFDVDADGDMTVIASGGDIDFSNENITTTGTFSGINVTSGADPGHTHTGGSISGIDISDDTNLAVTSPITLTDDSVGMVNQGTTTTVLHGNAAGNPTFGTVDISDDSNLAVNAPIEITDDTLSLRVARDLVAGTGLSGGDNNVLPGSDADTTLAFDATELDALTWDAGTIASFAWTWSLSGLTDPTLTFANDLFTFSNSITVATGKNITLGTTQWNSADEIDGTKIKDADYGDVDIDAAGDWQVENASHTHTASNISDLHAGTDITADLEEETHAGEHANGGGDAVDHDTLTNFVANEHIDHTAVTLTAGIGISGGGDISANRSFAFDATELGALTWGDGTAASFSWSFSLSGATDPAMSFQNNLIEFTRPIQVDGLVYTLVGIDGVGAIDLDYGSNDITDHTFLTDGSGTSEIVLPTGSIDSTEITDDTLLEVDLKAVNAAADEDILTYETTTGDFEWHTLAELGGGQLTQEEVEDYAGTLITDGTGTHTHISVTYQDATGDVDFVVDPDSVAGAISAGAYADDSVQNADIDWSDIDNLDNEGLIVVADTTDTTSYVALWESATGSLAAKSDAGITYNAGTGTLNSTVLTEGGNAVYNSSETPGGELGGTWASPTIDDSVAVSSWTLTTSSIATSLTVTDDDWIGLGSGAGRIEFDNQATDEVNILNAKFAIGTSTPQKNFHLLGDDGAVAAFPTIGTKDFFVFENNGNMNMVFVGSTTGNAAIKFIDSGAAAFRGMMNYDFTNDSLDFYSAGSERMNLNSSGLLSLAVGIDSVGAADLDYGSVNTTDHTFTTDSTGDAEIVLPNGSIGYLELNANCISSMTDVTSVDADYLLLWDATDSALKKVDAGEFRTAANAAGNAGEIQFNDGASGFDASSDFTYDDTNDNLTINDDSGTPSLYLTALNDAPAVYNLARIIGNELDGTQSFEYSELQFHVQINGSLTESLTVDGQNNKVICAGDLEVNGNDIDIGDAGGFSGIKFDPSSTQLEFWIDGGQVGHIGTDGAYVDDVP